MPKIRIDFLADNKQFVAALKSTDKNLGQFQRKINDASRRVDRAFKLMAVGAIAGAGQSAFALDDARKKITRATGAIGAELDGQVAAFKEIAKQVPESLGVTGASFGDLRTLVQGTDKDIAALTKKALDYARVTGAEPVAASKSLGQVMKAFSLNVKEGEEALDTFTAVAQSYAIGGDELLSNIAKHGAALTNLGLSAEETAVLFGELNSAGLKVRSVSSGLSTALQRLANEGHKDIRAALNAEIEALRTATDETYKHSRASTLFGATAAQQWVRAIERGLIPSLDGLGDRLGDVSGRLDQMSEESLTVAERFKILRNRIQVTVGEHVLPVLETFANWFTKNDTVIIGTITAIGAAFSLWAGVKVVGAIKATTAALVLLRSALAGTAVAAAASTGVTALGASVATVTAALTGPAGLIAAIGLLGVAAHQVTKDDGNKTLKSLERQLVDIFDIADKVSTTIFTLGGALPDTDPAKLEYKAPEPLSFDEQQARTARLIQKDLDEIARGVGNEYAETLARYVIAGFDAAAPLTALIEEAPEVFSEVLKDAAFRSRKDVQNTLASLPAEMIELINDAGRKAAAEAERMASVLAHRWGSAYGIVGTEAAIEIGSAAVLLADEWGGAYEDVVSQAEWARDRQIEAAKATALAALEARALIAEGDSVGGGLDSDAFRRYQNRQRIDAAFDDVLLLQSDGSYASRRQLREQRTSTGGGGGSGSSADDSQPVVTLGFEVDPLKPLLGQLSEAERVAAEWATQITEAGDMVTPGLLALADQANAAVTELRGLATQAGLLAGETEATLLSQLVEAEKAVLAWSTQITEAGGLVTPTMLALAAEAETARDNLYDMAVAAGLIAGSTRIKTLEDFADLTAAEAVAAAQHQIRLIEELVDGDGRRTVLEQQQVDATWAVYDQLKALFDLTEEQSENDGMPELQGDAFSQGNRWFRRFVDEFGNIQNFEVAAPLPRAPFAPNIGDSGAQQAVTVVLNGDVYGDELAFTEKVIDGLEEHTRIHGPLDLAGIG